jgi:hypothetical protein
MLRWFSDTLTELVQEILKLRFLLCLRFIVCRPFLAVRLARGLDGFCCLGLAVLYNSSPSVHGFLNRKLDGKNMLAWLAAKVPIRTSASLTIKVNFI